MTGATDKDHIIKHLEMIQGVINRLADNSFTIKKWSIALVTVTLLFAARFSECCDFPLWLLAFPVMGFWILDAYFLSRERTFRRLYNEVRVRDETDFDMVTEKKPWTQCLKSWKWEYLRCWWGFAGISWTLVVFYPVQLIFVYLMSCHI